MLNHFLNHRSSCPICSNPLTISIPGFELLEQTDNNLRFTIIQNGMFGAMQDYMDLLNTQIIINIDGSIDPDKAPFGVLSSKLKRLTIKKNCYSCKRYLYRSEPFDIDLDKLQLIPQVMLPATLNTLIIFNEVFALVRNIDNNFNIIVHNKSNSSHTALRYCSEYIEDSYLDKLKLTPEAISYIIPNIEFTTEDETFDRISTMLLLS